MLRTSCCWCRSTNLASIPAASGKPLDRGSRHRYIYDARGINRHFKPCMTDIYLNIVARITDYMATHPYMGG